MRILIATTYTIPAYSGGWTTPLDLIGNEHQVSYVVRNFKAGNHFIEGINCVGVGASASTWQSGERYRNKFFQLLFRRAIAKSFDSFKADFVLCLDPNAGYAAKHAGLPYAMRFHSAVGTEMGKPQFRDLLQAAQFSISGPTTFVEGVEVIPHNQDLSRFKYTENRVAERAILLTSIDPLHEPELFIEGIMLSKTMKGDIVGAGEDKEKVGKICKTTNGRVRCLPPVPRLQVPGLLSNYQVGVATVKHIPPVIYQMKVNAYMASGLYTLVKPWTHIAAEAPDLVRIFESADELASQFDYLSNNWLETVETRKKANEWIREHYSVDIPRKRFREILREKFPLDSP